MINSDDSLVVLNSRDGVRREIIGAVVKIWQWQVLADVLADDGIDRHQVIRVGITGRRVEKLRADFTEVGNGAHATRSRTGAAALSGLRTVSSAAGCPSIRRAP